MAPPQVVEWLERTYPKPRVDPEWLDGCCDWVQSDLSLNAATQTQEFIANVENQLLESNFRDSMLEGTGFPLNIATMNNVRLSCGPVLCEVTAVTEIGHSAFSLLNVRQTRIEREDLAGLAAEEGVENDEGPCPDYPRTMLRLEIGDGTTTVPAIEYRKMSGFKLSETPLGFKLVVKGALVRRGIVFLEPGNVDLKGHRCEDLDRERDYRFVCGLRRRLRQPDPPRPEDEEDEPPHPELRRVRSPLRDLGDPRLVDRMVERGGEIHHTLRTLASPPPPQSSATLVPSRFFGGTPATTSTQSTQVDLTQALSRMMSPVRGGRLPESLDTPPPPPPPPAQNSVKPPGSDSFEYDFGDEIDDAFLHEIEVAENAALGLPPPQASQSVRVVDNKQTHETVVSIEDDEEDDKENMPVSARRVRQRTLTPDVIDISD